jgi:hypothetical protein
VAKISSLKTGLRCCHQRRSMSFAAQEKKDSGSARQGETANTETCVYPNRLNLTLSTCSTFGPFKIFEHLLK